MQLIGINGFKTSGKDTTFEIVRSICAEHGQIAKRVAFADKLKIMAMLALGFERPHDELILLADSMKNGAGISVLYDEPGIELIPYLNEDLSTGTFLTGRAYLQNFGNHAREVFSDTFWIDQVLPGGNDMSFEETQAKLTSMHPNVDVLVVTDVRYRNEAEKILDLWGDVWEVIRPGIESDGHASEIALDRDVVDFQIINDGSIDDLTTKVRRLLGC